MRPSPVPDRRVWRKALNLLGADDRRRKIICRLIYVAVPIGYAYGQSLAFAIRLTSPILAIRRYGECLRERIDRNSRRYLRIDSRRLLQIVPRPIASV